VIEISAQITADYKYAPLPMDVGKAREHKPNQIVRLKVYGVQKPGSVIQMNLYWACCQTVANVMNDLDRKEWNTKNKVDFGCRVELHFVDPELVIVRPDKSVQFHYRSIAFKNLKHIERCSYFDEAFKVMAKVIDNTVEMLQEMAKSNMKG